MQTSEWETPRKEAVLAAPPLLILAPFSHCFSPMTSAYKVSFASFLFFEQSLLVFLSLWIPGIQQSSGLTSLASWTIGMHRFTPFIYDLHLKCKIVHWHSWVLIYRFYQPWVENILQIKLYLLHIFTDFFLVITLSNITNVILNFACNLWVVEHMWENIYRFCAITILLYIVGVSTCGCPILPPLWMCHIIWSTHWQLTRFTFWEAYHILSLVLHTRIPRERKGSLANVLPYHVFPCRFITILMER